ncbi:MAG TPA: hypothetical protein VN758_08130 [Solirubrobacterales bacterium]|nr:hypothetical protein [Solirubrobacterales bacterium]
MSSPLPEENVHLIGYSVEHEGETQEEIEEREEKEAEEFEMCDDGEGEVASEQNPEADLGQLCVFVGSPFVGATESTHILIEKSFGAGGIGKAGGNLHIVGYGANELVVFGTFAVTAP